MKPKLDDIIKLITIAVGLITILGFFAYYKLGWRPTTFTIGPFGGPIPTLGAPLQATTTQSQIVPPVQPGQSNQPPVAGNERIAFISSREDQAGIYVMKSDGSSVSPLIRYPAYVWSPAWSPDGKWIAFASDHDDVQPYGCASVSINSCNFEIYIMAAGGGNATRLTNNPADDEQPAWSPDGKKIAFVSNRDDLKRYKYSLYQVNAGGTNLSLINSEVPYLARPAWSPDGKRIALVFSVNGHYQIFMVNSDGSGQINLTNDSAENWDPAWSPYGNQLAFTSNRDDPHPTTCGSGSAGLEACNTDIYVMNVDGKDVTRLTNNPAPDEHPTWSPDGKQIAFVSKRDGNDEIYVMNSDGNGQINLTNNPADDWDPSWSPLP